MNEVVILLAIFTLLCFATFIGLLVILWKSFEQLGALEEALGILAILTAFGIVIYKKRKQWEAKRYG